jgi:uncharacterized protein YodC (DUF2158 family)
MNEFAIGDVVQLKSGGPKMTVHRIIGGSDLDVLASAFKGADKGDIECKWFDNGRIESAHFKPQMLALAGDINL